MTDRDHQRQQQAWRGARGPQRDERQRGIGITRQVILRLVRSLGVVLDRTLTFALDALGTATHGAMLYRNATMWTTLAPNASPLPLITQGVGAAPVWTPLPLVSLGNDAGVHGNILFWNGTSWAELAPGTDGRVLTTHDVGFDPTWGSVAASVNIRTNGTDIGARPNINFLGSSVLGVEDGGGDEVEVTVYAYIEPRTSDPGAPVDGQVWLRTDL